MKQKPFVFVSYARSDGEFVQKLSKSLEDYELDIWLDTKSIPPGTRWDTAIQSALEASSHLLMILSKASVQSQNVLDEVGYALDEKKTIIPILIEDCTIPLRVRRLNWINFKDDYEVALARLLNNFPSLAPKQTNPIDQYFQEAPISYEPSPIIFEGRFVLILEDLTEFAEVLEASLDRLGIAYRHETHGTKALAFVSSNRPDLILLDLQLPDISGWKFLEVLKELYPQTLPKIIIISTYQDHANRLLGIMQGVSEYLFKPFTTDDFEQVIKKVLSID